MEYIGNGIGPRDTVAVKEATVLLAKFPTPTPFAFQNLSPPSQHN